MLGGLLTAVLMSPPQADPRVVDRPVGDAVGDAVAGPRYALEWDAPSECPGADVVRDRVDELLANTAASAAVPDAPDGVEIVAVAQVRADEPGYIASLQLRSGASEGVRELGDPDCRELGEAVALIVALAVDPQLMSRTPEPANPVVEEPEDPIIEHPPIKHPTIEHPTIEEPDIGGELEARPPRLRGFGVVAHLGVGFATISPANARVGLGAAAFGRLWRVEVGASAWIPRRVDIGRFSIVAAELRGCVVPELDRIEFRIEFPICLGAELGAMLGVGEVAGGRRASAPWIAATPGVGVSWVFARDRFALGVRADAVTPLVRPAFASDEGRLLLRAGFGAQVLAGMEVRLQPMTGPRARRTWTKR